MVYSRTDQQCVLLGFDRDPGSPTFLQIGDPQPVAWDGDILRVRPCEP